MNEIMRNKGSIKNTIIYLVIFCFTVELFAILESKIKYFLKPSLSSIQVQDNLGVRGRVNGRWNNIKLNKYGFNDANDYDKEKKNHTVRIICLGDSITFGTYISPYNWPNYLEQMLREKNIDAEVINTAIPGNNYTQLVQRFEKEYLEFKPDIVIIYKGFRHYMSSDEETKNREEKIWTKLLRSSSFIRKYLDKEPTDLCKRLIEERKKKGIKTLVEKITEQNLSRYRRDLEHLIQICRKNNITLVLSPFLTLADENNKDKYIDSIYEALYYYPSVSIDAYIKGKPMFNALTQEIANKEGLAYVDISRGIEHNKDYFSDNYHLTIKGSKQVAENYAEVLEKLIKSRFNKYAASSKPGNVYKQKIKN